MNTANFPFFYLDSFCTVLSQQNKLFTLLQNISDCSKVINIGLAKRLTILEESEFVAVFAFPKDWTTVMEAKKCCEKKNQLTIHYLIT